MFLYILSQVPLVSESSNNIKRLLTINTENWDVCKMYLYLRHLGVIEKTALRRYTCSFTLVTPHGTFFLFMLAALIS